MDNKENSIELPILDLSIFRHKYNIEYILFLKSYREFNEDLIQVYKLNQNEIVFENNIYRIYKLN